MIYSIYKDHCTKILLDRLLMLYNLTNHRELVMENISYLYYPKRINSKKANSSTVKNIGILNFKLHMIYRKFQCLIVTY